MQKYNVAKTGTSFIACGDAMPLTTDYIAGLVKCRNIKRSLSARNLKYYEGDSRSVGSSTCPQELSQVQALDTPGDMLWGMCHTKWSLLPADTPHSSPDDLFHSHLHPHLPVLREIERDKRGHNSKLAA